MRLNLVRLLALSFALCLTAACEEKSGSQLTVSVVTDMVAGPEFGSVEIELLDGKPLEQGATRLRFTTTEVRFGDAFARGREVATLENVPTGAQTIRVTLLRPTGGALLSRVMRFTMNGDYSLRVPLTRDCVEVECPNAAAPGLSQCLMGTCVDERCNPDDAATLEFCPSVRFCENATDCRPVADCASQVCEVGICTQSAKALPDANACPNDYWCDPTPVTGGCTTLPQNDGDAGAPPGVACDTVCFLSTQPCRFGVWQCTDTASPMCVYLGNRPAGTECGFERVCNANGECQDIDSTDGDAGVDADAGTDADAGITDASTSG